MDEVAVIKEKVRMGGVWKHQTKDGQWFLSGPFTYGTTIEIWPNEKRKGAEGEKDPDYNVVISQKPKKPVGTFKPKEEVEQVPF